MSDIERNSSLTLTMENDMKSEAKINDVFFNEEMRLASPDLKFIKFLVDKEYESLNQRPGLNDYVFHIGKMLHILIDEMQCNEDVQDKMKKFIDDYDCNLTVDDFLNVE